MKVFTVSALIACGIATVAHAQQAARTSMEAYLVRAGKKPEKLFLLGGKPSEFSFVKTVQSTQARQGKLSGGASIFFIQPADFSKAMDLFEGRKYGEAATAFADVASKYAGFSDFEDNYSTLAGFYELESLRKQLAVADLVQKAAGFDAKHLSNTEQLQQIEIYKFWQLMQSKSWKQLVSLSDEWKAKTIADSHRAQIAYCRAVALQGLGKQDEALDAYAGAFTADTFKSSELVRAAAIAALEIYLADKAVAAEIAAWGTAKQNKASKGYKWLVEANALAKLYNKTGMGSGVDLDPKFAAILKCTPSK